MTFPDHFDAWLQKGFAAGVPETVKAFAFNLFEPALVKGVKFGVELVGTSEFNPNDSDWACEEVWEPEPRRLNIPLDFSGENWEQCLTAVQALIKATLEKNDAVAVTLKSRVGVGFVDGDLHVIQAKPSGRGTASLTFTLGVTKRPPLLSPIEVDRLLRQHTISDQHPWVLGDEQLIEGHLKAACAAVGRLLGVKSKIEWGHYGSGYASFVDAWFFNTTPEFNVRRPIRHGEEHTGLIVLLCRLAPFFAFMEGEKHWHPHGGSSYLPEYNMLDRLETSGVKSLAEQVQPILESHGLTRVQKEQLGEPLTTNLRVPTLLTDRWFTQFDALFYWED